MSEERDQQLVKRERASAIQRKAREFREVPGEDEADAVRDAFLNRAGQSAADVASRLGSADLSTRERVLNRLQQERGNAYVRRVVDEAKGTPGRLVGLSQPEMVEEVSRRKGSGSALPGGARAQMEGFFGADLGDVQIHADGEAAALSRELDAQAFTVGRDVYFAAGKYDPTSSAGQGLLAHELAHVRQQGGLGSSAQRADSDDDEAVEREAAPEEEEDKTAT